MIKRLRSRGLIPAALVTFALVAALLAPPVGAALRTFLTTAYCTGATISAAPASPSPTGTTIVVTGAASGCTTTPVFEFWAMWSGAPGTWYMEQAYSATPTWSWNSTGAAAGTEHFGVWVKDSTSAAAYDAVASMAYVISPVACSAVAISAAPASPAPAGTSVVVTAAGTCPNASPKYQFYAMWSGAPGTWYLEQAWSTTATWTWNSAGATGGAEKFGVWVLDAKSTSTAGYDAVNSVAYTVTNGACTAVTLTPAPAAPQAAGASIVLTAAATCPNASPVFEFWAMWSGAPGVWYLEKAYSTTATWTWNSTGAPAGTESFGVWVKDSSAAAATQVDKFTSISYVIT